MNAPVATSQPLPQSAADPASFSHRISLRAALFRLAAFFLLVGAALFATDRAINFGLRHIDTGTFGDTNRVVAGAVNARILITGSSRAALHYDPRLLQASTGFTTFNLGRNGSQTDMQLALLRTYLRHNRPPELLIHNLDLFSFVTSHEIYDPAQYLPYLDEPDLYAPIKRVYPQAWKWKRIPLYGYVVDDLRFTWVKGAAALVGRQPRETTYEGFTPRDTSWTGEFDAFVRAHPKGKTFDVEPQGVADLTALLALARAHKIPVLLVYSPEYAGIQPLERNRTEIFAQFRSLAAAYGAELWDYSDSPLSSDRENFFNSQHLNATGAMRFSSDLAQRLSLSRSLFQAHR